MQLTDSLRLLFIDTANSLKGSARRLFMARTVKELGPGGQRHAERELAWSRVTIRKGMRELESGFTCLDAFALRGRKRRKTICPLCYPISKPLSIAKAKQTPSSVRIGSIRV